MLQTTNEIARPATVARQAALAVALGLMWLTALLFGTGELDHAVLRELYSGHRPALADAARLVTMLGDGRVVTLFAFAGAVALVLRKQTWPALVLVIGSMLGKAVTELQKYEFNRMRPAENPHLVVTHNLSFPSGHSANAMMTYIALVLFLVPSERRGPWLAAALAVTLLVGLSRTMLGVHWPSDVLGGWSYGLFWALFLAWIARFDPFRR